MAKGMMDFLRREHKNMSETCKRCGGVLINMKVYGIGKKTKFVRKCCESKS